MFNYASSTGLISDSITTLFAGLFDVLTDILPFAIGILVFYVGWNWARRAIGGR